MFAFLLILPLVGASNTHGQLLRSEEIQACTDTTDFSDEDGYPCNYWVGYDCSQALEQYSYSQDGENAIMSNCRASCGLCTQATCPSFTTSSACPTARCVWESSTCQATCPSFWASSACPTARCVWESSTCQATCPSFTTSSACPTARCVWESSTCQVPPTPSPSACSSGFSWTGRRRYGLADQTCASGTTYANYDGQPGCCVATCPSFTTSSACPTARCVWESSTCQACTDTTDFIDEQGLVCISWVSYDCSLAFEEYSYSQDGENALMSNCRASCGLCTQATLTCTSCPDDDGGCSENTPYIDNRLGVCVAFCTGDEVPQRVAGKGINVKSCTSCPPPGEPTKLYADHENHICVSTCPPGKAPNEKGACAVCKPPYSYADHVNKKCVAKCPPGKVPDTLAGNDCKECQGEFPYADHESHACVKQCGPGKVGHLLTQECRTCETGKYANHKNHSCDTDCPLDHPYKDGLDCVMTCSEGKVPKPMGVGDPFICSFCPSGKFADHAKHECVETCSTGYTPDPDGTLDPMYKNDCKRCPLGKFADHEVKACVVDCPNGTTKNAAKRNCDGPGAAPCMPVYVPVPKPVPVYITPAPPVPAPTPTV